MYLTHWLFKKRYMRHTTNILLAKMFTLFKKPKEENPQLSVKLCHSDGFIFWIAEILALSMRQD